MHTSASCCLATQRILAVPPSVRLQTHAVMIYAVVWRLTRTGFTLEEFSSRKIANNRSWHLLRSPSRVQVALRGRPFRKILCYIWRECQGFRIILNRVFELSKDRVRCTTTIVDAGGFSGIF